jgi:Flp pilus assembly protein TadB
MNAVVITVAILLTIVVVLIFVIVIVATILVTIAIRHEERLKSLNDHAPDVIARLARMLLGVYSPRDADEIFRRPRSNSGSTRPEQTPRGE